MSENQNAQHDINDFNVEQNGTISGSESAAPTGTTTTNDAPLAYQPRMSLRHYTKKCERGLPEHDDLVKLAIVYGSCQRQYWPELVALGLLPPEGPEAATKMAESYAEAFRTGQVPNFRLPLTLHGKGSPKSIAACYLRYSCENSNPRTLDDQLEGILRAARAAQQFIPWPYVLADSSVSGTIAVRRGYLMVKDVLCPDPARQRPEAATLYVYDMSRASRDIVESHRLARFARSVRRNIVGVSDGFDLSSPHADIQLMAMSMYSQMLIGSVRDKVRTGMRGAAKRGTSTGRPAFGYRLVPVVDSSGREQISRHGAVIKKKEIDPNLAKYVELAYRMVGIEHKSYERVREAFNNLCVGGKNNWWPIDIAKLLANPVYIGIEIFNRSTDIIDPETGKKRRVPKPRSEWLIRQAPELRIISDSLWCAARRRMHAVKEASPLKGRDPTKQWRLHPKTLFSGTLVCGHCKKPLKLLRGGQNSFFRCTMGQHAIGGCVLRAKAVRTVEDALLSYIKAQIIGPEQVQQLVQRANSFLAEEAARPSIDVGPLREEVESIEEALHELANAIVGRPSEFVRTVVMRIEQLERKRRELQQQIRDHEQRSTAVPAPLTVEAVNSMMDVLRELLNEAPAVVGPILHRLTGTIEVFAEPIPGRKRQAWIMRFPGGDLVPVLAERAKLLRPQTPESYTLDLLTTRSWSFSTEGQTFASTKPPEKLPISHKRVKYAAIAEKVGGMVLAGHSWVHIAKVSNVSEDTVQRAYRYYASQHDNLVSKPTTSASATVDPVAQIRRQRRSAWSDAEMTPEDLLPEQLWCQIEPLIKRPVPRSRLFVPDRTALYVMLVALKNRVGIQRISRKFSAAPPTICARLSYLAQSARWGEVASLLRAHHPWLIDREPTLMPEACKLLVGPR